MEISANPEYVKKKIKVIRSTHYLVLASFLSSIFLMLFSRELAIYGAVFIASVGLTQALNKGRCPLTVYELNARKLIGDNSEEKFIEGVFRQHLNLSAPAYAIRALSLSGIALAGYTIVVYLSKIGSGF